MSLLFVVVQNQVKVSGILGNRITGTPCLKILPILPSVCISFTSLHTVSSLTESMIIYDRINTSSTRVFVGILSSLTDKFFYAPVVSHCIVLKNGSEKVIVECSL